MHSPATPELLYLLSGDEEDFLEACADLRPADIAEALNELPEEAAVRIVAALPFHRAVEVFDEPELERRGDIFAKLAQEKAVALLDAMSADQQVEIFRDLDDTARGRLEHVLAAPTRDALKLLLKYPETTAGGIMTTEFVSVPSGWTVRRVLEHIHAVGEAKETVYAIYILDDRQRLAHVVSLR
jgi:magnesium transporter